MRFAITGSHGVGKTSTIDMIEDYLISKRIRPRYNSSKARDLKAAGFGINDEASDTSELLMAANHISYFTKDNWFNDRSIVDTYAYASYNYDNHVVGITSRHTINAIYTMCQNFVKRYDALFFIPIEFEMEDDGLRKVDENYRNDIEERILHTLKHEQANYHVIKGSMSTRAKQIKTVIENLQKTQHQ
jgi:nicotinamide riboside kinase